MMVVPRQYAQELRKARSQEFDEKSGRRSTRSLSRSKSPLLFRGHEQQAPKAVSKSQSLRLKSSKKIPEPVPARPQPTPLVVEQPKKKESAKEVLSSTAIPIRRKPRGRPSQRLPRVDHVAHFSTLLMDDIKLQKDGLGMKRSVSSHPYEGLFGNMDELLEEGQMYVGSEGLDSGILTTRSMSDESIASLPSPDDYTDHHSQHSTSSHLAIERRLRQMATSEDCTDDHPLSPPRTADNSHAASDDSNSSLPTLKSLAKQEKPRQSLKSSLTASLKALKSAAQSISNRSSADATNARAKSFFEFHPGLTDDRRPPISFGDPTADLRRYLSPPPLDNAAQLHFWQDHRHSGFQTPPKQGRKASKARKSPVQKAQEVDGSNPFVKDLPSVVQLADCLPGPVKTEHASSPPIWLAPDGTPINKSTAVPLLFDPKGNEGKGEPVLFKHREPRENPDFLRVFVCEMQMRKAGKLSENMGQWRARLWLPPVSGQDGNGTRKESDSGTTSSQGKIKKRGAQERMSCLSIGDM